MSRAESNAPRSCDASDASDANLSVAVKKSAAEVLADYYKRMYDKYKEMYEDGNVAR